MKIKIKNRWTNDIILCGEYGNVRDYIQNLQGANLWGANLFDKDGDNE